MNGQLISLEYEGDFDSSARICVNDRLSWR